MKSFTKNVQFSLHETKPTGIADLYRTVTVSLETKNNLPAPPKQEPEGYRFTDQYWLPKRGQWIGFTIVSETGKGKAAGFEESISGPYLVEDEPPTESELIKQTITDGIVRRSRRMYQVKPVADCFENHS